MMVPGGHFIQKVNPSFDKPSLLNRPLVRIWCQLIYHYHDIIRQRVRGAPACCQIVAQCQIQPKAITKSKHANITDAMKKSVIL